MLKNNEIRIRDPFILPIPETNTYYLYGTTDDHVWDGKGTGFNVYKGKDLENWEGPFPAFRPSDDFWADHHFWAPEVHFYEGKYYMFATFKAEDRCRGTQILVSDDPLGPFTPLSHGPVTPADWECLDGTLFIDDQGDPWMIFCHEWLQVQDGEICALRLSKDLREAVSEPMLLFKASESPWTVASHELNYVTDGPFLYRNQLGDLLMLWSSSGEKGYAIGVAKSQSGDIRGPWLHHTEPLFAENGGHGMLFQTFDGQLMLTIHAPNNSPNERPVFFKVREQQGELVLDE